MARPTLLTPDMHDGIVKEVRAGLTLQDAAELNGIDQSTLHDWVKRGKTGEEPFGKFAEAVTAARAQAKADAIKAVRAGVMMNMAPDWKAEAWFLERTFPDQFAPQQAVHVKVEKELEKVLDQLKTKLPPEVYDQVLTAIAGDGENVDNVAHVSVAGEAGGEEAS